MSRILIVATAALVALSATAARGQTSPGSENPPPLPSPRPFSFDLANRYVYDSNINHSKDQPRDTRGTVFGLQAVYRTPAAKPTFELSYEIARHFHTAREWDRLSHDLRASWEQRLSKVWNVETVAEMSLKGSSEDQEITNQYRISPRIEYRFDRENRLRLYGVYRIRQYPDDRPRDAHNRYLGTEYSLRSGGGSRLDVGYRYEINRARDSRHHYTRWSYYTQYAFPLGSANRFELEAWYRPRRYDVRRVRVDNERVLRRDRSWIFSAAAIHTFRTHFDLSLEYRYETRSSNDPDKFFNEHTVATGIGYHF